MYRNYENLNLIWEFGESKGKLFLGDRSSATYDNEYIEKENIGAVLTMADINGLA